MDERTTTTGGEHSAQHLPESGVVTMVVLHRSGQCDARWLQTMTGRSRNSVQKILADLQHKGLVLHREVPRSVLWRLWPGVKPQPFTLYSLTDAGSKHPELAETIRKLEDDKRSPGRRR